MSKLDDATPESLEVLLEIARCKLAVAVDRLHTMACWDEGDEVTSSFDNPDMASMARQTLKEIRETL